jgi:hypothetical protein
MGLTIERERFDSLRPPAGQVERSWRAGSRKTDSTSSRTLVARSATTRESNAWGTGARVTPLWLTATYSPPAGRPTAAATWVASAGGVAAVGVGHPAGQPAPLLGSLA